MNKVKYGLSQCHYAVATDDGTGALTYGTVKPLKGARNLSLEKQGETLKWRADNVDFFTCNTNNGYEGDLELALLSDDFRKDILGEELSDNGLLVEKADAETKEFALLFQFEGDDKATRHVLYRCAASRPAVSGATTEESIEPQTETVTITAMPRISDQIVKARCYEDDAIYENFFNSVVEPTTSAEDDDDE